MNKAIIIGNLGADPDLKSLESGTQVCNLSIATESRNKKNGEWINETEWHRVTVFNKTAENCHTYLRKGAKVCIIGRIKTDKYTDKEGVEKYTTKIIANEVEFLSRVEKSETKPHAGSLEEAQALLDKNKPSNTIPFDDDDIPF